MLHNWIEMVKEDLTYDWDTMGARKESKCNFVYLSNYRWTFLYNWLCFEMSLLAYAKKNPSHYILIIVSSNILVKTLFNLS